MTIRNVPLDSQTEQKHRLVMAQAINELIKAAYPVSGSWTPIVRGQTLAGTYELGTNFSRYSRVGRRVFVDLYVILAGAITGGGTGSLEIAGLPYGKTANTYPIGMMLLSGIDLSAGGIQCLAPASTGTSSALIIQQTIDNSPNAVVQISSVTASDVIAGSICYETDDP